MRVSAADALKQHVLVAEIAEIAPAVTAARLQDPLQVILAPDYAASIEPDEHRIGVVTLLRLASGRRDMGDSPESRFLGLFRLGSANAAVARLAILGEIVIWCLVQLARMNIITGSPAVPKHGGASFCLGHDL